MAKTLDDYIVEIREDNDKVMSTVTAIWEIVSGDRQ